ncbi:MAG TPA: hypothetical protein PKK69_01355 [Ferruginibacter sp.]|nr:hypothetical protein [Ferruginibacter sp.]
MKFGKVLGLFLIALLVMVIDCQAQCSLCTKTASQLGEKTGLGLNKAILYLMLTPFAVMGYIAFRWWKSNRSQPQ